MPAPTAIVALRDYALRLLTDIGLNPVRIPGRRELYRCSDETTFLLRAAPKGTLMTKAKTGSPNAAAPMWIEGDHDFVVVVTPGPHGNGIEVYRIPTPRAAEDLRNNHAAFAATHPNATDLRALAFGGDPASLGRGYREKYREFLITPPDLAKSQINGGSDRPDSPLERALQQTLRAASEEYEVPTNRIRISIGVMFRTGEVVLNWNG